MKNKAIGIIGGMGPEASEKFYGLLIKYSQSEYGVIKNEDFPEMYLASVPVPDFISDQKHQVEALEMLKNKLSKLDELPIGFYCLACNTGHILMNELRESTKKPFVSLLEEVPEYLRQQKMKRVGLLATPTTIKLGMYELPLKNAGIELIVPGEKDTEILGEVIKETIAGKNLTNNSVVVQQIAKRLLDRGAEGVLESCTEIPLIFPKQHLVPVFDTLEILAKAVLKKYYINS